MIDKPKPSTDVNVINPLPIPVKLDITTHPQPSQSSDDAAAAEIVAKADVAARALEANAKIAAADKLDASTTARENRKFDFYQIVLVALIAAAPGVITAWRIGAVSTQVEKSIQKTEETHDLVNSTSKELLKSVSEASRAKGVLEGKADRGKDSK